MPVKQRLSPCLWFDDQAEDAAKFYVSVFRNQGSAGLRDTPGPARKRTIGLRAPS
jgi:predicted 3-demethylubiquinone-9 3-methyltransferase (glyoxalase superfamily)